MGSKSIHFDVTHYHFQVIFEHPPSHISIYFRVVFQNNLINKQFVSPFPPAKTKIYHFCQFPIKMISQHSLLEQS